MNDKQGDDFEIQLTTLDIRPGQHTTFRNWPRLRWRVLQAGALLGLVLLLFVLLIHEQPGNFISDRLLQSITAREPNPTLIVQTDVSSGTLTVNGKPARFASPPSLGNALILAPGRFNLTLSSPPFRPLACSIDVGNTMIPIDALPSERQCSWIRSAFGNIPTLDMNLTPLDLPAGPGQQLQDTLASLLAGWNAIQQPVLAGEHIAIGSGSLALPIAVQAPQPLQARVQVTLRSDSGPGSDCSGAFCPQPLFSPLHAQAPVQFGMTLQTDIGWQFRDLSGNRVATYMPSQALSPDASSLAAMLTLNLTYDADGWRSLDDSSSLASQLANHLCTIGATLIHNLHPSGTFARDFISYAGQAPLSGCLLYLPSMTTPIPTLAAMIDPLTDTTLAWVLVHYGAVLDVNEVAQRLFPQLPRATASEVAEILAG